MKRTLLPLLMSMALMTFLLTACSKDQPTGPALDTEQSSLDQAYGGFTTSDELPGFGDADLINAASEDVEVADPFNSLGKSAEANGVKTYVIRLAWGKLEGDSTATAVVDWSGYAEVNKGTLAVLKTIRFENNDRIQLPRTSRQRVELASHTQTSHDGILIALIDNDSSSTAGTLTLLAGSYSRTLNFSELDSLDLVEPVSDGNEVSIVSRAREMAPFNGGFLAGRWIKENRHGGIFQGRWINSLGTHAGFVRGIWGVNRNGENVFFGKYISVNGEFRGLLGGHWAYDRDEEHGVLRGHWVNRNHQKEGTLKGHFKTGPPGSGRGYFQGRWREE